MSQKSGLFPSVDGPKLCVMLSVAKPKDGKVTEERIDFKLWFQSQHTALTHILALTSARFIILENDVAVVFVM